MQENQPPVDLPQDKLLAELITKHKEIIWKIHDHDSLLENQVEQNLTEEERKAAWEEYENEKKGIVSMTMQNQNSLNMNLMMRNMNPELIKVDRKIKTKVFRMVFLTQILLFSRHNIVCSTHI